MVRRRIIQYQIVGQASCPGSCQKEIRLKSMTKGKCSGLVKLSFVHDCFQDGDLHVLLFKEKVFILWYFMFWHLCLDLINLNGIQDW